MMHTRKLIAGVAGVATLLAISATPAGAHDSKRQVTANLALLSDLLPTTVDATDGAAGAAAAISREGKGTRMRFVVWGLDPNSAGTTYGAHVHSGTCEAGNPTAAGPHYNSTGGTVITDKTEIWLDFEVSPEGTGAASARVPFVIPDHGAHAIVIHAKATAPDGTAGARLACMPLDF